LEEQTMTSTDRLPAPDARAPLAGSLVVVTGATGGIGAAVAHEAGSAGGRLALVDLDRERLEEFATRLRDDGIEVEATGAVDVRTASEVERFFAGLDGSGHAPGAVVHCAGGGISKPFLATTPEEFSQVVELNALGTFNVAQAAARRMLDHGGSIVVIGSAASVIGTGGQSAYAASKGAVSALVRVLATELGAHGVRVNELVPGPVESDLSRRLVTSSEFPWGASVSPWKLPALPFSSPRTPRLTSMGRRWSLTAGWLWPGLGAANRLPR
jgi:NAD(P)-dependent dehydrogenase (short-subunit alcohol dehydrogenase family)